MKTFFEKNKAVLAIISVALIICLAVYISKRAGNISEWKGERISNEEENISGPSPAPAASPVQCLAPSKALATKVIDGDTIIVKGGYSVRILGIDADELGYPCYDAAKKRLEDLIFNKEVRLEKDLTDVDQYKRCLRYVFLGERNISLELVKEGLVIARFYEPDVKYKEEIALAEETAIDNKIGCKWEKN